MNLLADRAFTFPYWAAPFTYSPEALGGKQLFMREKFPTPLEDAVKRRQRETEAQTAISRKPQEAHCALDLLLKK